MIPLEDDKDLAYPMMCCKCRVQHKKFTY